MKDIMELHPHQRECVAEIDDHLWMQDNHPCVVIPITGGKTPVIATICQDAIKLWNGRVIILDHVKELLEQTTD